MIARLHGTLETLGSDWAIINVNGIGFQVYMPTSTLASLGATGHEVHLHTHFLLRDDGASLYGFGTGSELELFQALIGVSGLGPRLALAILSAMTVEQLSMAIATGSTDMLNMVPGIGKKVASRIILELKEKIGTGWAITPATQVAQENADVLAALTSLGYSAAEAVKAVASLPADSELVLEEKIKLALQYLGSK